MSDAPEVKCDDEPVPAYIPYELPEAQAEWVRKFAKPGHKPCSGTGVSGWCKQGAQAVLCTCVQREMKRLEPVLLKVKHALEEKARELQAGPEVVPEEPPR